MIYYQFGMAKIERREYVNVEEYVCKKRYAPIEKKQKGSLEHKQPSYPSAVFIS